MSDYLEDRSIPLNIRNNIPVILSMIPTQDSVNVLIGALATDDILLKQRIIKALNKLHTRFPDIPINQQQISDAFIAETKTYYEILQILHIHERNSDAGQLLKKSLEETLDQNLEQIFRLLGLKYHPDDIFFAYLGITSSKKNLRDSAIEFLDNVLGKDQKKYLFPILDRDADEIAIRQGRSMFEMNEITIEESLEYLLAGTNTWLKTCAIYYLKEHDNGIPESLRHYVQEAAHDEHEFVKETAQYILNITNS